MANTGVWSGILPNQSGMSTNPNTSMMNAMGFGSGPLPIYVSNQNQPGYHDLDSWFAKNNLLQYANPSDQNLWNTTPGARDSIVGSTLQKLGWRLAPGNTGIIAPWAPQGWEPPQGSTASFWDMHPGQQADTAMQNMNRAMGLPADWTTRSPTGSTGSGPATTMFGGNPMATGTIPGAVTQGNLAYSGISPQENLLQQLFQGSATGQGTNPIAQQLYSLGMGQIPGPMADQITATTNEQFGKLGSRFGTEQ